MPRDSSDDSDEDDHDFTQAQLDHMVDTAIAKFVEQYGHDSCTSAADYIGAADSVKQPLPLVEDNQLFSRAQVRGLIQVVSTGCGEVLKSKSPIPNDEAVSASSV